MVLWFFGRKKLWFSGSLVVKKHVLWFFGLKKLWSSGHPSVLLYFCFFISMHTVFMFLLKNFINFAVMI